MHQTDLTLDDLWRSTQGGRRVPQCLIWYKMEGGLLQQQPLCILDFDLQP